jgi:hypothetical protein
MKEGWYQDIWRLTVGCKKNGNFQNKIDTFLQFFHSVKPSYEGQVRINVKI